MAPDSAAIEDVRRRFYESGVTVVDWARAHDFDVHLVYGVLNGRSRARRGESHRIAVALGLKPQPQPLSLEVDDAQGAVPGGTV